jgi:hypothetical protein
MTIGEHVGRALAALALGISPLLLAGCGVIGDALDGRNGYSPSPAEGRSEPGPTADGSIVVTVEIESDGSTATDLAVAIHSPGSPQSLYQDSAPVPFSRDFTVSTEASFPLRGTTVEVHAAPDATFVTCRILVDGEEVARHRSEGSRATATCERRLELGPS